MGHGHPRQPAAPQRGWGPGPGWANAKGYGRILGAGDPVPCSLVPHWMWCSEHMGAGWSSWTQAIAVGAEPACCSPPGFSGGVKGAGQVPWAF